MVTLSVKERIIEKEGFVNMAVKKNKEIERQRGRERVGGRAGGRGENFREKS